MATSVPAEDVRQALARLLAAPPFSRSPKISRLLSYLVQEMLAGRAAGLKEMTIAIEVFEQTADFNPRSNPIVRVNASRLRNLLRIYYNEAGRQEPIQIHLASVGYVPVIRRLEAGGSDTELTDVVPTPEADPQVDAIAVPQDRSGRPAAWLRHSRIGATLAAPASVALVLLCFVGVLLLHMLLGGSRQPPVTVLDMSNVPLKAAHSFLLLCQPSIFGSEPKPGVFAFALDGRAMECRLILRASGADEPGNG